MNTRLAPRVDDDEEEEEDDDDEVAWSTMSGVLMALANSISLASAAVSNERMRPLAVTTSKRSPDLPDVPPVAESGFAGFEAPAWWAVLAPAKTPPDIVKRMNEELNKALKNPDVAKKLDAQGIDVVGGTPEVARVFIDRQIDIWAKVVKDNQLTAD